MTDTLFLPPDVACTTGASVAFTPNAPNSYQTPPRSLMSLTSEEYPVAVPHDGGAGGAVSLAEELCVLVFSGVDVLRRAQPDRHR